MPLFQLNFEVLASVTLPFSSVTRVFLIFVSFLQIALDLCNPNPCQQGLECHSVEGRFMCACPDGYHGRECVSLRSTCKGQHCESKGKHAYLQVQS